MQKRRGRPERSPSAGRQQACRRTGRPARGSEPKALLDDLLATARWHRLQGQDSGGIWLPVSADQVPLRALVRDALTTAALGRIDYNRRQAERLNLTRFEQLRSAPKSVARNEVDAALEAAAKGES